jgi:hypothetical protein
VPTAAAASPCCLQAFAREAGEEDVEEWCNGANLHEIRDISLADMVAMLSGEDPDDRHDGGEAAEAVVEAPCGPRSTGSVAPTGPTASPAAAQEQPLAVAVEEGLPGEAAAPSRQAPSPAPNSTGAGAPTPHPAPQQGLAGGGRSTRDALQAADAAGLGAGAAEDPAQAPGGGVDAGEAAASEELELASEHTASDYLGVALVGGCWQARVSLRLDAQGRPSPQADACRQAVAAASELGEQQRGGWAASGREGKLAGRRGLAAAAPAPACFRACLPAVSVAWNLAAARQVPCPLPPACCATRGGAGPGHRCAVAGAVVLGGGRFRQQPALPRVQLPSAEVGGGQRPRALHAAPDPLFHVGPPCLLLLGGAGVLPAAAAAKKSAAGRRRC